MRGRRGELVGLAALMIVLVIGNGAWILHHRSSTALDGDEQNLVNQAEDARLTLRNHPGSVLAWPDRDLAPSEITAPVVPIATALPLEVFGHSLLAAMLPILASLCVLVGAAWALARQLGAGQWSLLAAAVVGTAPVTVWFSRSAHHIVPAAACLTATVAIGLRTNRLERRGWSVLLGVAIGASVLTRTMLIAIVPWALGAWAMVFVLRWRVSRAQVVNFVASAVAAVATASWWWLPHGATAIDYLRHGPVRSDEPWWDVSLELRRLPSVIAGPPAYDATWLVTALLAVTLTVVVLVLARGRILTTSDGYVAVVVVAAFGALVLATDDFPGFFVLVAGLGVPWAVAMGQRVTWRPLRQVALGLWTVLALLNVVHFPRADLGWYPVQVGFGYIGAPPNGEGWSALYDGVLAATRLPPAEGCVPRVDLPQLDDQLARGHLRWAVLVDHRVEDRLLDIEEIWDPDELEAEARESRRLGESVVLIDDGPLTDVPEASIRPVLQAAGFRRVSQLEAPDGRTVVVWRPPPIAPC